MKVDTFGMVNLIAGERIVPELIQDAFTPDAVAAEAVSMLTDGARAATIREELARRSGEAWWARREPAGGGSDRPDAARRRGVSSEWGIGMQRVWMMVVSADARGQRATATVLVPVDLGDLSREARAIARGRVRGGRCAVDRRIGAASKRS